MNTYSSTTTYPPTADPSAAGAANPYLQPPLAAFPVRTSPGLAFALGFIPGVGAIYNGQYMKGLVHAIIYGLLLSLANSVHESAGYPLLIMTLIGFVCYMPFEAYHTAKRRQAGMVVEEWSSLFSQNRYMARTPIGPILLILLGVLFLLDSLRLIEFRDLARFWPVLLIVVGAVMLYSRLTNPARVVGPTGGAAVNPAAGDYAEPRQ